MRRWAFQAKKQGRNCNWVGGELVCKATDDKGKGLLNVRAVGVNARANAGFTLPSRNTILASRLDMGPEGEAKPITTTFGALELDFEGLYRIPWQRRHRVFLTKEVWHLNFGLVVYTHMGGKAHLGTASIPKALQLYRVWVSIEAHVVAFAKQYLHYMDVKWRR